MPEEINEIKEKDKPKPTKQTLLGRSFQDIADGYLDKVDIVNFFDGRENPNHFYNKDDGRNIVEQVKYMKDYSAFWHGLSFDRRMAVASKKFVLEGEESKEKDFIEEMFSKINIHKRLYDLTSVIETGFCVVNPHWQRNGSVIEFTDLEPEHPGAVRFDENWNPFLSSYAGERIYVPERSYKVLTFDQDYKNRYGQSLFHRGFWNWWFLVNGDKYEALFVKLSTQGIRVITSSEEARALDEKEIEDIKKFIKSTETTSGLYLPPGYDAKIISNPSVSSSGATNTFANLRENLKRGAAMLFLGQSSLMDDGTVGSRANSETKKKVTDEITSFDINLYEGFLLHKIIVPALIANGMDHRTAPKPNIVETNEIDMKAFSEALNNLVKAGHKRIPIAWVNSEMGIPVFSEDSDEAKQGYLTQEQTEVLQEFADEFQHVKYMKMKDINNLLKKVRSKV